MTQEEKQYMLPYYDILHIYRYIHSIYIFYIKETELTGAK